jgi:putative ABC transport system permease protein
VKYMQLVWPQLWRNRKRTMFTIISVAIAFLMFAVLIGFNVVLQSALAKLDNRLFVASKYAQEQLPIAYKSRIEETPGVSAVSHMTYFGGYFKDRRFVVPAYASDVESMFKVYRSLFEVSDKAIVKIRDYKNGAIVSEPLAALYGWKVGDKITLGSSIWTRKDGGSDYEIEIVGTFKSRDGANQGLAGSMFIRYDYLNDSRLFLRDHVQLFIAEIANPAGAQKIIQAVDRKFENSPAETMTMTEQALLQSQMTTIKDLNLLVNAVVGASFFSLLFVIASTMAKSVRERRPEFAVLKTIGFSNGGVALLVFAEAAMLCLSAAALGLLLARGVFAIAGDLFATAGIPWVVWLGSFGIATVLAVISSALPAWRAGRLTIIESLALRR